MIFSVLIILIIAVVAYFHYVQGLFSAGISAFCAALAAIIAVAYHETVITALFKGAVANVAQAMVLCGLFALSYFLLRLIFDKSIPGNVRFPLMVDKIGAAVMGIIAGLFASGVFALAAGSLPFGASIAGYARYSVADRTVIVPGARGNADAQNVSEIKDINLNETKTALDPSKRSGLIVPVDDMVAGIVGHLSTGALANDRPLAAVHPDWPTELFGQRAGVQVGAKRVLLNLPGVTMVELKDVFKLDTVPEIDADFKVARETPLVPEKGDTFKPAADEVLLVTRVNFTNSASDDDSKVRVSCMGVRLVAYNEKGDFKEFVNYHPIGTLEEASVLMRNKPDDPLIVAGGKSVDFVFKIPREAVFTDPSPKPKEMEFKEGVFLEVKRMAQMDLGKKIVKGAPTYDKNVEVIRKPLDQMKNMPKHGESAASAGGSESSGSSEASAASPIQVSAVKVDAKLFVKVAPGQYNDGENVSFKSGNAVLKSKKFEKLVINPGSTVKDLSTGDFATDALLVPDGKKMVQVSGKKAGSEPWAWAQIEKYALVDASGVKYQASGGFGEVIVASVPTVVGNYDANGTGQNISPGDGRPNNVHILFNVPAGAQIKELQLDNQNIYTLPKPLKVP